MSVSVIVIRAKKNRHDRNPCSPTYHYDRSIACGARTVTDPRFLAIRAEPVGLWIVAQKRRQR